MDALNWAVSLGLGALSMLLVYAAVCTAVAHRLTRALRLEPMADPLWHNTHAVTLVLQPRGQQLPLAATYFGAPRAMRAVLFVHGKDCCRGAELRISTQPLVRALLDQGISVLMLDLRGHGDSGHARLTYGLDESADVLGAVDWLRQQGYANNGIGVLAASMGAASVLRAARRESAIGPLVLDSAFADFPSMMRLRFRQLSGLPNVFLPGSLTALRWATGTDLRRVRPADDAAKLSRRPVLVIHAEGDPFVPANNAHVLAAAAGAELWVTPGQHHLASFRDQPQEYVARVARFFDRHLDQRLSPQASEPQAVVSIAVAGVALRHAA